MDFSPTDTQRMLADSVAGLLDRDYDFDTRRKALAAPGASGLWRRLAEFGVLGVEVGEEWGGSAGHFDDLAAVLGPLGRALAVVPFLSTVVLGAGLISAHGSRAQKTDILPAVAAGDMTLCLAHAERPARDVVGWVEARAERTDTGWLLDGAKSVVLGGDDADICIISARTSGRADDPGGVCLFIVPGDTARLERRCAKLYDGSGAADLGFSAMALPKDALLGAAGDGLAAIEVAFDRARAALCVEAIGVMERLCEITLDYLRTRVQFGQPIGKFQALQHRMVDAHIEVELARSMSLLAISAVGDTDPARRGRAIAAAKARISWAARIVGQSAVQLHGGIALTDEYAAGHYFKRLTMIERLFGNAAFNTSRYAAMMAA